MHIIFPTFSGNISGYYGELYDSYAHEGLDIAIPVGTLLYAPADGVVAYSGTDKLYGEYIRTYHPQLCACFFFAHLDERFVQTGNSLLQGQPIGTSGNTGNSTGPHLHFSVRQMNAAGHYMTDRSHNANATLDPLAWLAGWLSAGNTVQER